MSDRDGGSGSERLAPVIPLFGARASADSPSAEAVETDVSSTVSSAASPFSAEEQTDSTAATGAVSWRSTWSGEHSDAADRGRIEDTSRREIPGSPSERHPARGGGRAPVRLRALESEGAPAEAADAPSADEARTSAEELLVRKLRTRSLSISEARLVLRGFERNGVRLESSQIDDVLDEFERRGYLDDGALAEQLIRAGFERKGQGRVALSRALAQRGIPRDVIDSALSELPDDDAARALDFARTKASSLARLEHDTALRRLVGQLARRGYNGSVAMSAAKAALAEVSRGRPTTGVRFVESD
ncbi:RecX family transcriptional regulator [Microbacterium sp. C5A9]|nr:RecX family transcriptional regulator [Microbacterium sp. C5A9]